MKTYKNPKIEILLFDREEVLVASSPVISTQAVTAAYQLNGFFFDTRKIDHTTTIKLEGIEVK